MPNLFRERFQRAAERLRGSEGSFYCSESSCPGLAPLQGGHRSQMGSCRERLPLCASLDGAAAPVFPRALPCGFSRLCPPLPTLLG